ncbi:hypothetical protein [Streptomyces sp. NPDC047981]|uniref:COG1470 family protein n=1 Tax=Streptomyces sp. NPDC047981 TaxID=3154610 RepID=UPI00342BF63E
MQLESDVLAIPGEESTWTVQVMNTGTIVDRFELDILGEAKGWITAEPSEVNVFPDQSVEVRLVFTPPRSAEIAAGEVTFGLRVMSHEDIEGSVVEEYAVTVGSFTDYGVTLVPATKRGKLSGRFNAVVDNRGNAPLKAHLYASDPDAKVEFAFKHEEVEVAYGKGVVVPLKVKPTARKWRGTDSQFPFQVLVVDEDDEDEEQTADGVLVQAAIVSDALAKFALAVFAAVMALFALWYFVLKPSVESEARKQVAVATGQDPAAAGGGGAGGAGTGGGGAGANGGAGAGGGTGGGEAAGGAGGSDKSRYPALNGSGTGDGNGGDGAGGSDSSLQAVDFRIQTEVRTSDEFVTTRFTVPRDQTYYISDILFENAAGDTGVMRLQRGESVLRQLSLDTFRDRDDHFVEPIEFGPGEEVILSVRCQAPGGQTTSTAESCTPAAYFSGRTVLSAN